MEVERRELDRLTNNTNHQGVALAVAPYKYQNIKEVLAHVKTTPLVVILDGVTDPRNLGAVIRSAAGFYANAVVVTERRSAGVTGAVWKTAAGALSHVPVCQVVNITRTITELQERGFFAIALTGGGDLNLDQVDPDLANRPLLLVIGAEGRGVSRLVAQTCDLRVQIPMSPKIDSLNAAVATGVALYSITRSRKLN
jgi:23S rRNA (guanosine2251-2'-O)-methyltransferase